MVEVTRRLLSRLESIVAGREELRELPRCFYCNMPLVGGIGKYIGNGKFTCNPASNNHYDLAVHEGVVTND